jgi:hypothetical protein
MKIVGHGCAVRNKIDFVHLKMLYRAFIFMHIFFIWATLSIFIAAVSGSDPLMDETLAKAAIQLVSDQVIVPSIMTEDQKDIDATKRSFQNMLQTLPFWTHSRLIDRIRRDHVFTTLLERWSRHELLPWLRRSRQIDQQKLLISIGESFKGNLDRLLSHKSFRHAPLVKRAGAHTAITIHEVPGVQYFSDALKEFEIEIVPSAIRSPRRKRPHIQSLENAEKELLSAISELHEGLDILAPEVRPKIISSHSHTIKTLRLSQMQARARNSLSHLLYMLYSVFIGLWTCVRFFTKAIGGIIVTGLVIAFFAAATPFLILLSIVRNIYHFLLRRS